MASEVADELAAMRTPSWADLALAVRRGAASVALSLVGVIMALRF